MSYLDRYRVSLDDSAKSINDYLEFQTDLDKRLRVIKNIIIRNMEYAMLDTQYCDSESKFNALKLDKIKELNDMINK